MSNGGSAVERYLRADEVAARTGIRESTLRSWRRAGKGPRWQRMGIKSVRYPESGVQQWVDEQQKTTKGEQAG